MLILAPLTQAGPATRSSIVAAGTPEEHPHWTASCACPLASVSVSGAHPRRATPRAYEVTGGCYVRLGVERASEPCLHMPAIALSRGDASSDVGDTSGSGVGSGRKNG